VLSLRAWGFLGITRKGQMLRMVIPTSVGVSRFYLGICRIQNGYPYERGGFSLLTTKQISRETLSLRVWGFLGSRSGTGAQVTPLSPRRWGFLVVHPTDGRGVIVIPTCVGVSRHLHSIDGLRLRYPHAGGGFSRGFSRPFSQRREWSFFAILRHCGAIYYVFLVTSLDTGFSVWYRNITG